MVLPGRDLPGELLQFARSHNITQIILGKSRSSRLRELLGRSLVDEVTRSGENIAVAHHHRRREAAADAGADAAAPGRGTADRALPVERAGAVVAPPPSPRSPTIFAPAQPVDDLPDGGAVAAPSAGAWRRRSSPRCSRRRSTISSSSRRSITFTIACAYEVLAFVVYLIVAILISNLGRPGARPGRDGAAADAHDAGAL